MEILDTLSQLDWWGIMKFGLTFISGFVTDRLLWMDVRFDVKQNRSEQDLKRILELTRKRKKLTEGEEAELYALAEKDFWFDDYYNRIRYLEHRTISKLTQERLRILSMYGYKKAKLVFKDGIPEDEVDDHLSLAERILFTILAIGFALILMFVITYVLNFIIPKFSELLS